MSDLPDPTFREPFVYLACPFSHDDDEVEEARYEEACRVASHLMNEKGLNVFSPITNSFPLEKNHGLSSEWDFWKDIDRAYLRFSYILFVLTLNGWQESTGVTWEIGYAKKHGMPIRLVDPDDLIIQQP